MFDKRFEHFPAPFSVDIVACDAPHVKQTLDRFWTLQVVCVGGLDVEIALPVLGLGVHVGCGV
jgi:hypothetical protein